MAEPILLDNSIRSLIATKYLRGSGIEIGALHTPLRVPGDVIVRYVDRMSATQLKQTYPELAECELVEVDIVEDGESLASIPNASVDFIIANQMIEHCQNPIFTIENWVRVLKQNGILYMGVPDKRYTFDCDRPVTPLEHLIRDYSEGPWWSRDLHFDEWARLVDKYPQQEVAARAGGLADLNYSIHFHVWTQAEFLELLLYCRDQLSFPIEIESVQENGMEFIVVLRKTTENIKQSNYYKNNLSMKDEVNKLRLDLGCGSRKKEGTIGIDIQAQPSVDYVLNIQTEPLPFPDQSVDYVHSSHFLEHIDTAHHVVQVFKEISRVCVDGAALEFWTPYAWSNSAFIFGHNIFYNEDHYLHLCVWNSSFWQDQLKARWVLKEITYVIDPEILIELYRNKINVDFALKYYKDIVREFGVFIEVNRNYQGEIPPVKRTFTVERSAKRYPIDWSKTGWQSVELENAFAWFSSGQIEQLPSQSHQVQTEELLQVQLQQPQTEMERSRVQVQQTQDMAGLQAQLQQTQLNWQQAEARIQAMQTSKFWKLRTVWFNFKKSIGLVTQEE